MGIKTYDSTKTDRGLTLIDNDTWHSFLVDMHGNTKKKFSIGLIDLLPDGYMVGRLDSFLVKFDSNNNIIWKTKVKLDIHHIITHDEKGNIYLLSSHSHQFLGLKVRFDVINIFSPSGTLIYEWCTYDHLKIFTSIISKSAWLAHLPVSYAKSPNVDEYIKQAPEMFLSPTIRHYDNNLNFNFEFSRFTSVEVLSENSLAKKNPAFKKGNLLLCFNPYSSYGILNISSGKIEWVRYLPERTTLHSPTFTTSGTILVFQNSTDSVDWTSDDRYDSLRSVLFQKIPHKILSKKPDARLWTSITEYDPLTNNKVWEYTAMPKESMQAPQMGNAQRLTNGNTLVCITTKENGGRIFELTPDKKIVWDYSSSEINPENGKPIKLYRAKRISLETVDKIKRATHVHSEQGNK